MCTENLNQDVVPYYAVRSLPQAGRRKNRDPFFDVGADEVGKFLRRAAKRVRALPL